MASVKNVYSNPTPADAQRGEKTPLLPDTDGQQAVELSNTRSNDCHGSCVSIPPQNSFTSKLQKLKLLPQNIDPDFWQRWSSIFIVYLINFLMITQQFMYYTSLWPFLLEISPPGGVTETFFGVVIMAFNVGSAIASPIFGAWSNRIQQTRIPIIFGISAAILGNIFVGFIEVFPAPSRKWVILFARFVTGIGTGNSGALYAYTAMASKPSERNTAMALRSASSCLGVVVGPAFQLIFVPFGYPGTSFGVFHLNMYTAPAFTSMLLGLVQIAVMIWVFREFWVAVDSRELRSEEHEHNAPIESSNDFVNSNSSLAKLDSSAIKIRNRRYSSLSMYSSNEILGPRSAAIAESSLADRIADINCRHNSKSHSTCIHEEDNEFPVAENSEPTGALKSYDLVAVCALAYVRFILQFCYTYDITIGSPLSMVMFGWSASEAVTYNAMIALGAGVMELFLTVFVGVVMLKYVKERVVILIGLALFTLFYVLSFSWPGLPPIIPIGEVATTVSSFVDNGSVGIISELSETLIGNLSFVNATELPTAATTLTTTACDYVWCSYTTKISLAAYLVAYSFMTLALTTAYMPNATLYSKVVGPRKQGFLQGIFAGAGQFSMVLSPILCSNLFQYQGPRVTWAVGVGFLSTGFIVVLATWKRLVPWVDNEEKK